MTQSQEALGRDTVAMALNGVGVVSTLITLVQLAVTRGLPVLITGVTGLAVVSRLVFLNRCSTISPQFSKLWKEAMQIGGFSLMPQAMQAIFRPYLSDFGFIPNGTYTGTFALIMILLARYRRLPTKATRFFEVLSAGVPAVLVLWAPIVQLWTSCWSPANADLVQICTGLLAILSNCASLPLTQSKHQTLWTF